MLLGALELGTPTMNGFSFMNFEAEVIAATLKNGAFTTDKIATWTAGLDNPLKIVNDTNIKIYSASPILRVSTRENFVAFLANSQA